MNLERAAMMGKLAEAREKEKKLILKGESFCSAIRQGLNTALTPFTEMEIPQTMSQMDDLVMAWSELQKVQSDIGRLERELR
jgi:hypothetical protein